MSNRYNPTTTYSFEKKKVTLEIVFDGNTTSNPILKQWDPVKMAYVTPTSTGYRGVTSVTRSGVGIYVVNLQDRYMRLLGGHLLAYAIDETTAPAAAHCYVKAQAVNSATAPSVTIVTYNATAATPVELDANTRCYLTLHFSNSAAL